MKIIRTFCQGKQLLLNDKLKLSKYLRLVQQTPIPYQGVRKALGYDTILNNLKFETNENDVFALTLKLIKRDIAQLDFLEFTSYLSAINNFIASSPSEYPQNEQVFQDALRIILENGTFIQRFLAVQHIVIYFDSKITLYSQLATQLKDSLRDHQPKNTEERILKLFWEQMDIFDQEKIEGLIENQQTQHIMQLEERMKKEFLEYADVIQVECEEYNLTTQMIIYEIISRLQFDQDVEMNEKRIQQIYYVSKICQCKIEARLSDLNNFHLVLYTHLLNLNKHDVNILSWDQIINELTIRDLSNMAIEDAFKIWLLLYEIGRQNQIINDRIIEKLMNDIERIKSSHYVLLCELLVETKNSKATDFLKKWYPIIDLDNESAQNLSVILDTFNSLKLLNKLVLGKFLKAMDEEIMQLDEIYIENILISLVDHQVEHKKTFSRAVQFELFENTSKHFLLNLLHYCQLYNQTHEKVHQIQEVLVQNLEKEYDDKILIELLRILVQGTKKNNPKNIEVIPELKTFIKKFLDAKEGNLMGSESQFRHLLQKLYNIK